MTCTGEMPHLYFFEFPTPAIRFSHRDTQQKGRVFCVLRTLVTNIVYQHLPEETI
jgi:hypothetical protein